MTRLHPGRNRRTRASVCSCSSPPPAPRQPGNSVVFEDEITPALDAALGSGLEVTAIHNHFVFDRPRSSSCTSEGMGSRRRSPRE
jgi:hypothetical protein